jgi:hypothetical protein
MTFYAIDVIKCPQIASRTREGLMQRREAMMRECSSLLTDLVVSYREVYFVMTSSAAQMGSRPQIKIRYVFGT